MLIEKIKELLDKAPEDVKMTIVKMYWSTETTDTEYPEPVKKLISLYDKMPSDMKKMFLEHCEKNKWEEEEEEETYM